jgi:uncharacterized protein YjbJ (UPF0337 family)
MSTDRLEGKSKELEGKVQQGWASAKDRADDAREDAKDLAEDVADRAKDRVKEHEEADDGRAKSSTGR